jgi:sugar phosphate isomerase/epimerase
MPLNRRAFIKAMAVAGLAGGAGGVRAQPAVPRILFGLCASLDNAEKLKAIGYDFIEGSVSPTLKPERSDAEFAPDLERLKACALPIRSCASFIPKAFRLTGPDAAQGPALDYAVTACRRADAAGIAFLVLGSSGARNVPKDFDMARGKAQFIQFCRSLGDRIKDCKVTVLLEPLNKNESNLLNSVGEGIEYVDAIRRPRIQLLADIYHMMKEGEGPDSIRKAGARIRHCHIAELEGRSAPGTNGEDLGRFFNALRDIGYVGGVSCECRWPKEQIEAAWAKALRTMRSQAKA